MVATGLFGLLCLSGRNALLPMVRHLRALPMPAWKLNAYIVGLSTPVWLSVLGVASVLHAAVTGRLPAIHADLLVLLAGMTAVAHSIQLPSRRAFSMSPAAMPLVVGVFVGVLRLLPDPAASFATPMWLGAAAFATAAVSNHLMLTRRASIYRPAQPGFADALTGGR